MYDARFELKRRPFPATPDSSLYYPATAHEAALAPLARAIGADAGLVLLTGEPGAGKTLLGQVLLELQAVHLGHAHIGHEATGLAGAAGGEERARRGEDRRLEPLRLEQEAQRLAHAGVVVDDEEPRRVRHWAEPRPARAAA